MADVDFLARHAANNPTRVALISGDRKIDFDTLNRRANQAANLFQDLGCAAHDRVAVMSFNSVEGFEISNGLRKVGLVGVPVNYRLRDRLRPQRLRSRRGGRRPRSRRHRRYGAKSGCR